VSKYFQIRSQLAVPTEKQGFRDFANMPCKFLFLTPLSFVSCGFQTLAEIETIWNDIILDISAYKDKGHYK